METGPSEPAASDAEPAKIANTPPPATSSTEPAKDANALAPAADAADDKNVRRRPRRRRKKKVVTAERRGPTRKPSRGPAEVHDAMSHEDYAQRAVRLLSSMARGLLDEQKVHILSRPQSMEFTVRIPITGAASDADVKRAAAVTIEQVRQRVSEVQENARALAPGAVFSFFDDSADAEGCRPTESRQVFEGYSSTGRPNFTDFVTLAIERKAEGIDAMVNGENLIVTHVSVGRVLRTAQLHEFGKSSPVFRILGQVDAGLYAVQGTDAKAAFSFQLLRGATLEGRPVLYLHPVGHHDVLEVRDPSLPQILSRFASQLEDAALRLQGLDTKSEGSSSEAEVEEQIVLPLLQELAKRLSGRGRRKGKRTEHADQRVSDGGRPTTKAFEDANSARDDSLFWDEDKETLVVVGPRGRVHVFGLDGRHVTSVVMNGDNIRKRKRSGRWRQAEPDERGEFRMRLRS